MEYHRRYAVGGSMMNERCPCCNRKMFKLKSGQWTHLFSKAFEEARHG